jgi:Outer membrane protein beta-barrel domain
MMKRLLLGLLGPGVIASAAFAGVSYSGKEMKQVAAPPPCPQWYADNEFNVSLWGTYAFTGNNWRDDRYIEADHAWGGGVDFKYFFHRYFGVGLEGFLFDARQAHQDVFIDFDDNIFDSSVSHQSKAIGSVLGTLTLRYPIPCTRFSPYVWAGGGGIFGGGQRTHLEFRPDPVDGDPNDEIVTQRTGSETRGIGQFGGGIEVRFTPHIGWISDFSWNIVGGPENNFGMVRTGINFAF